MNQRIPSRPRFEKPERLKSRKEIESLFGRVGHSYARYPLRMVWRPMDEARSDFPVQFALSVPKRKFKRAVVRNVLRRRIREAYRLHKAKLYRRLGPQLHQYACMVLYTGQEVLDYATIARAMEQLLHRFPAEVARQYPSEPKIRDRND